MTKKVEVHTRKKPIKKKKWMNTPDVEDDIIAEIGRRIDRLSNVSKKGYTNVEKIDLFETCIVMNVIFSAPGGTVLMLVGASNSNFNIFVSGVILLLEGIFVYALISVIRSIIRNLILKKIHRNIAKEFKPQIIVRNGGSDPYIDDGLTSLGLPLKGFRLIGEVVRRLSEICGGKVIDLIASGYNEQILPHAWLALIAGLGDFDIEIDEVEPIPQRFIGDLGLTETEKVVQQVKDCLKKYWKCLR